jgi:hypothetical protein
VNTRQFQSVDAANAWPIWWASTRNPRFRRWVPAELTLVAKALLNLLVVAALVFGSSIIAQVGESWNGWRLLGYPGIAVTGFFLASALGVYLAALALIPARRHTVGDPASRPRPDGE